MTDFVLQGPLWLFLGGAVMSLNPCMLAAVPLVASYVGSSGRYFSQSLKFMGGFTGTLALFGLAAGAMGGVVESVQQVWPWVMGTLYLLLGIYLVGLWGKLFAVTGIKVWGFYQTPRTMALPGRGLDLGAPGLGAAMAFSPSPCITPVVLAVTAYVVPTGGALKGAFYLFMFGVGHALPLLLAGSSAGVVLNRAHRFAWVKHINSVLGATLMVIGIYFLIHAATGA